MQPEVYLKTKRKTKMSLATEDFDKRWLVDFFFLFFFLVVVAF